jgi:hypothetical protein
LNLSESQINLSGTASALEAIVDAVLLVPSGAQLLIAVDKNNGTLSIPMTTILDAMKFGDVRFIILISATNVVVMLLFVAEAIHHCAWIYITISDYQDLKCRVVGISLCGAENAEVAEQRLTSHGGDSLIGDPVDTVMGKVRAGLRSKDGKPAVAFEWR